MSPADKLLELAERPLRCFASEPFQVDQFCYLWRKSQRGLATISLTELDLILLDSIYVIIERRYHATN